MLAQCRGYRYVAAGITTGLVLLDRAAADRPGDHDRHAGRAVAHRSVAAGQRPHQARRIAAATAACNIPREDDVHVSRPKLKRWRHRQLAGELAGRSIRKRSRTCSTALDEIGRLDRKSKDPHAPTPTSPSLREALSRCCATPTPDSIERTTALIERRRRVPRVQAQPAGRHLPGLARRAANPTDEQLEQLRSNCSPPPGPCFRSAATRSSWSASWRSAS